MFEGDTPIGIISERDLVGQVAEDPDGWQRRLAGASILRKLECITPESSVADASASLAEHRLRQLPVLTKDGKLAGIITQADLLHASHLWLEEYAANLERLVTERTAQLQESEQRRTDLVDLTTQEIMLSLYDGAAWGATEALTSNDYADWGANIAYTGDDRPVVIWLADEDGDRMVTPDGSPSTAVLYAAWKMGSSKENRCMPRFQLE